ncbi:cryptochrome/photolyase family protein [Solimonas soli]|uniref:cryptochrome/photolyase family protein n=1 Tax=Solimonas soli TaxID=413479 RepID=UPI00048A1F26|nr:deoxyribodipyrimidine photo-lyase [Solimonas soli]
MSTPSLPGDSTAIVWFRRDLRLTDNPALHLALQRHERVVPLFIADFEAERPWAPGAASRWWLHHSLARLGGDFEERGVPLLIRRGDSLQALRALIGETGAEAVYWNRLYEPALVARDRRIKAALREAGIAAHSQRAALWHEPSTLRTAAGEPYRVFTPFWRRLAAELPDLRIEAAPVRLKGPRRQPASDTLESLQLLPKLKWDAGFYAHWRPGEAGALHALDAFVRGSLGHYAAGRNHPAREDGTRLSPHLHFGELSPQQLRAAVLRRAQGTATLEADAEELLRELGWREFAHHLLFHFPHTPDAPLQDRFAKMPWRKPRDYAADLEAWQRGRTGMPIVDAGMRELWQTGWMHNRVRMIVASFLTKNLLIPWQEGTRWFWDTLLDADLANNTLGWQWTAGCGADAAPYFRIFNPLLQAQKFDADAAYIKRWLPELATLPPEAAHAPWLARAGELEKAGLRLKVDYPEPIVALGASRKRALEAYETIRSA